ncbi:CIA30 family protein [Rhodohalobacter sp. 8-1]|uniref:CIA30 family protein n=1 Tax=Rhodohalobacter sp. 8-1 TaxID=3131972 RepID=UPI0030EE5372
MKYLIVTIFLILSLNGDIIFDFSPTSDIRNWRIVDDVVMGGRSNGSFSLSEDGHGVFSGEISLENNGGFSSVRYGINDLPVDDKSFVHIRLKGDGKTYQFRIKHNRRYEYAYVHEFETSGKWQTIEIPIDSMYPVYRGRRLDRPNFDYDSIEELTFLIGNGRPQTFRLLIDKIELVTE